MRREKARNLGSRIAELWPGTGEEGGEKVGKLRIIIFSP